MNELAVRERAAYRRGVTRTTAVAAAILAVVLGASWYAFDRSVAAAAAKAEARSNAINAGLSELGRLAVANSPNRKEAAVDLIGSIKPETDEDVRNVAVSQLRLIGPTGTKIVMERLGDDLASVRRLALRVLRERKRPRLERWAAARLSKFWAA